MAGLLRRHSFQERTQLSLSYRASSTDNISNRRRARSPSGESVIEATSLTNIPSAKQLQELIHEETKMSGISIASIKTPPPFPNTSVKTDYNANQEKSRRTSDSMDRTRPNNVGMNEGIDRNSSNYHERTGLMRRSGRKSSVERQLEEELKTGEGMEKEQLSSCVIREQEAYSDVKVEQLSGGMTKTDFRYTQPMLGGSRIQKATGKLFNQYQEDQRFDHGPHSGDAEEGEEYKASVRDIKQSLTRGGGRRSKEKEEMEKELATLREIQANKVYEPSSDEEQSSQQQIQDEVKCRKSLSKIKTKYLAKTKGEKIFTSSDSEDDRKSPEKIEILGSSTGVKNVQVCYSSNEIPWQHPIEKLDARKEIENSPFSQAKQYYVQNENVIPWQHPVEKFNPREEIDGSVVKSTLGYYKQIEGEVLWQHPVEKLDPKSEIEGEVVKANLDYYREIEGSVPWQHPVVKEDPRNEIDTSVFHSAQRYYKDIEGVVVWQHEVEKANAKDEIDAGNVQVASSYFKMIETRKDDDRNQLIEKPVVNMVKDPFAVMAERRIKVDADDEDFHEGLSVHPSRRSNNEDIKDIDTFQIRAFRESYKRLETQASQSQGATVNKPKTKLINDDEARDVMAKHRKKSREEDEDYYESAQRHASYNIDQAHDASRNIDVYQVRASRETYRTLESQKEDMTPVNKPKMRFLGFDDAQVRMEEHRKRVEDENVPENDYSGRMMSSTVSSSPEGRSSMISYSSSSRK